MIRARIADQGVISLLVRGDTLWGGTTVNGGGGTTPKAKEAKLFTYDLSTGTKTSELTPVPGAGSITSIVQGPGGMLWGLADGVLFVLDPATSEVTHRIKLPAAYSGVQDELHVNPDEHVYASLDGYLLPSIPSRRPSRCCVTPAPTGPPRTVRATCGSEAAPRPRTTPSWRARASCATPRPPTPAPDPT